MAATKDDIRRWFENGQAQGATHMIVVCDTFDWDDYAVYVNPGQEPRQVWDAHNGPNMTKAMECYALWKPIDAQLTAHRVHDFDPAPVGEKV